MDDCDDSTNNHQRETIMSLRGVKSSMLESDEVESTSLNVKQKRQKTVDVTSTANSSVTTCDNILYLPDMILQKILCFMSYAGISELRLVCQNFNEICQEILRQGSRKLDRYHAKCFKDLKTQLPRRESERRRHPLARRCDILAAVETRLSLLSMTYSKYINLNLCSFIPGKVIDEAFSVLYHVQHSKDLKPMPELLQEFRDISSMAIEHFEEEIVPMLKVRSLFQKSHGLQSEALSNSSVFKQILELKLSIKKRDNYVTLLTRKVNTCVAHRKLIAEQGQKIMTQDQIITELSNKVAEQGRSILNQERRLALLENH